MVWPCVPPHVVLGIPPGYRGIENNAAHDDYGVMTVECLINVSAWEEKASQAD